MKTKDSTISNANVYQLDGKVPIKTAVPFGLQHILAMFVANISPAIVCQVLLSLRIKQNVRRQSQPLDD